VLGWKEAHTSEIDPNTGYPVIYLMREWFDYRTKKMEKRDELSDMGGTMRLGAYPCRLIPDTLAAKAYRTEEISSATATAMNTTTSSAPPRRKGAGGLRHQPGRQLVEIVELKDHPWFLGCQFHPEFKSRPMDPHPLVPGLHPGGLAV
jgi:CTP synthase